MLKNNETFVEMDSYSGLFENRPLKLFGVFFSISALPLVVAALYSGKSTISIMKKC